MTEKYNTGISDRFTRALSLILAVLSVNAVCLLSSCDKSSAVSEISGNAGSDPKTAEAHNCVPGGDYIYNTESHWRTCTICGKTLDSGEHTFNAVRNYSNCECGYTIFNENYTELPGNDDYFELPEDITWDQTLESNGIKYSLNDDLLSYSVIDLSTNTNHKDLYIPAMHKNRPVTCIASGAFSGKNNIKNVYIAGSVRSIGNSAFSGSSVETVVIANGLQTVGAYAFNNCTGLKAILLPESTKQISSFAFESCVSLRRIVMPEGLQAICEYAFSDCSNLKYARIPSSIRYIEKGIFAGCGSLESLTMSGENEAFRCEGNCLINYYTKTLISTGAKPTIPDYVTHIYNNAFYKMNTITELVIPEGVTDIGSTAFYGCDLLNTLYLPSGIDKIGGSAFEACSSLQTIVYGGSLGDWQKTEYKFISIIPSGCTLKCTDGETVIP